jgi:hypothetical protein
MGDRILYVSVDEIAWLGPHGLEPIPFGQAVEANGPIRSLDPARIHWDGHLLRWPGSEEGLVLIDADTDSALFTPGGERWGLAPLAVPICVGKGCATEFDIRDGQLVQYYHAGPYNDDGGWLAYRAVATGERPG